MQIKSYVIRQNRNKFSSKKKNNRPFLGRLDMELTERCNNNCIHCFINLPSGDREAKRRELSTNEIKGILKQAVSLNCLDVRFTGGEPLLREDFEELYIFSRKLGLRVLIFTNGTLITKRFAELFSRIPPLNKIEITLYGMKKSSYEAVTRAPGSFEAAREGINLLLKYKVPFLVKGALLPQNNDETEEFASWAATIPGMDHPPRYAIFFNSRYRRSIQKNKLISSVRASAEEGLRMITRDKERYLKERKEFCGKFLRLTGDRLFPCGAGENGGCINAYGYFQPCLMLRDPKLMYNLKTGSLEYAIAHFFPKIRNMKASNPEYLKRCGKCFLKSLCEFCPAQSWTEHGTLDTPVEYLCEFAHLEARYLGLLKKDERSWEADDWQNRVGKFINHGG